MAVTDDDATDFTYYETTTVDPGVGFTVLIMAVCILIVLSLPLWLRIGDRFSGAKLEQEEENPNTTTAENTNHPDADVSQHKRNNSVAPSSSPSAAHSARSKHMVGGYYCAAPRSTAGVSVVSSNAASSAMVTDVASAVLEARPKRSRVPQQRRKKHVKEPNTVRAAAELATTEHALQKQQEDWSNRTTPGGTDTRSECNAPSILSNLDVDAISTMDAVDAKDTGVVPLSKLGNSNNFTWNKLLEIADWDKEMSKFVGLAIPFCLQGVSVELFAIVNVAVIGHFIGVKEANAFVIVGILVEFTNTLTTGFAECIGVLVPHADGAGNDVLVGRYLQLGLFFYTIMTIPGVIIWALLTEETVLWFGFDEETASIGQDYAYTLLIYLFVQGVFECFTEFLNTLGHERYATIFTVIAAVAETVAIIVIAVLGVKDLVVVGLVQVAVGIIAMLSNIGIIMYKGWLENYWEGLIRTNGLKDRRAMHTVFITAIPLGVAWLLTFGEWEVMTLFARKMGPAEVAAWAIIGYVWSAFETVTDGFGDAAEVRVGFRMGSGQVDIAKYAGEKSIYFGVVVAIFETGFVFIVAEYLPGWLTPDPTLQKLLFDMLPLIGFAQIIMVAGMDAWAVIGAQGRVRMATVVEFIISWFIAVPLSALFVYGFNLNLESMVAALTIAYTVGANVYLYILLRSDWHGLSAVVIARNAAEGVMYDEYDWDDLPDDVRKAAVVLGYTQELWENDQEPDTAEKSWGNLTDDEQRAATLLGFNQRKWDADDDGSTDKSSNDKFDHVDWKDLPPNIRQAAKRLKFTKSLWNNDKDSPLESRDWTKLTAKQQDAAKDLGYDQAQWDGNSVAIPSYDDMDWDELPKDVRAAAICLQYTQDTWDEDGKSPLDDLDWRELTADQQKAAGVLGYNQRTWDDDDDCNNDDDSFSDAADSLLSFEWNELTAHAKQAARSLGYNKSNWHDPNDNPIRKKAWCDLTSVEQEAAHTLGFDERMWQSDAVIDISNLHRSLSQEASQEDVFSISTVEKIQQDITSLFGFTFGRKEAISDPGPVEYDEDGYWKDLPSKARAAAEILGYTEELWNADGEPPSNDKYWSELSPKEKQAAIVLGYSEDKWNDSSSVGSSTS
ncbi:MAG: hypothetical protein SGILL_003239 [Bacillariaceae sp.]